MKINICIPTFGNSKYTSLALEFLYYALSGTDVYYHIYLIKGKPDDTEFEFAFGNIISPRITIIRHPDNLGLPRAINDVLKLEADYTLVIGNDVFIETNFIRKALNILKSSPEIDWLSGTEELFKHDDPYHVFDREEIKERYKKMVYDFAFSPPSLTNDLSKYNVVGDSFNACFFSRRLVERIGFVDSNFYPAYFSDNDFARRAQLAGLNMFQFNGRYLHLWSRTIYNETHKGVSLKKINDFIFPKNKNYYIDKWGGEPGKEKFRIPFNGNISNYRTAFYDIKIPDPNQDEAIRYWLNLVNKFIEGGAL